MKSVSQLIKSVFDQTTLAVSASIIIGTIINDLKESVSAEDLVTQGYLDELSNHTLVLLAATFANTDEAAQINPDHLFVAGIVATQAEPEIVVAEKPVVVKTK